MRLLRGYEKARFCDPARPSEWAAAIGEMIEMTPAQFDRSSDDSAIRSHDWDVLNRRLVERAGAMVIR